MLEYLNQFERNHDQKVSFDFVISLFSEIGTESFNLKFKWFYVNCMPDCEMIPDVKRSVFSWIAKCFTRCDFVLSFDQPIITEANVVSFREDLEDIEQFLLERIND